MTDSHGGNPVVLAMRARGASEASINVYMNNLFNANGRKGPVQNVQFLRFVPQVRERLQSLKLSTQHSTVGGLVYALRACGAPGKLLDRYLAWQAQLRARLDASSGKRTDRQKAAWLTPEDVRAAKARVANPSDFKGWLEKLVLSLYTDTHPRRNQDYLAMVHGPTPAPNVNTYDLGKRQFVFNVYKTARTYGRQTVPIPGALADTIRDYLPHKPKGPWLLCRPDGSRLPPNGITRILNKIFGKAAGATVLRMVYINAQPYSAMGPKIREDAWRMGHSVGTQQGKYVKQG